MKILVLDDSVFVLKIVCKALQKSFPEIELVTASDGKQGYEAYKNTKPDFIITDLLMPDLSGTELIDKIRQKDSNVKIIILTADVQVATRKEVMKYGVLEFINKPITENKITLLLKLIKENLDA